MANRATEGFAPTARERQMRQVRAAGERDGLTLRAMALRAGAPAGMLAWWRSDIRRRDAMRARRAEKPVFLEVVAAHERGPKHRARTHRGLDRLAYAGPSSRALLGRTAERGGNLGDATGRLLVLLDTYGAEALECALAEVLARDVPHPGAVRHVLERNHAARGRPPATSPASGPTPSPSSRSSPSPRTATAPRPAPAPTPTPALPDVPVVPRPRLAEPR